jgi:large subunit ribosomal protein L17
MRHNKKINHLGRTKSHREAMLSNMASSLIKHKRIFTTTAKAKALRKYVEPLITKSKDGVNTLHSRRIVFASLQDKYAVKELFGTVSEKVGDRPGGYTRIIKTGNRLGDNAAMCFIELVDFNENMLKETSKKAVTKTRRSRRRSSTASAAEGTVQVQEAAVPDPVKTENAPEDVDAIVSGAVVIEETPETDEPVAEIEAPAEEKKEATE